MNVVRVVDEPAAKQDIRDARDYYMDKGENTSIDFRDELIRTFDLLARQCLTLDDRADAVEVARSIR